MVNNMVIKNRSTAILISVIVLAISFILVRFVWFEQHQMSQWSLILLGVNALIIAIFLFSHFNISGVLSSFGYIIGYGVSRWLGSSVIDPVEGAKSNYWFIWLIVLLVVALLALIIEVAIAKRHKPIIF